MQSYWKQVIEAYERVKRFLSAHPAPDPGTYAEAATLLDSAIAGLGVYSTSELYRENQAASARERRDEAMRQLRMKHILPLVSIANAQRKTDKSIAQAIRMPSERRAVLNQLAAAEALAQAAPAYHDLFIKFGRPADFLDQLNAALAGVRAEVDGADHNARESSGARAGLEAEVKKGRAAIGMLDAIVKSLFDGNDVVMREWSIAKRVHAVPMRGADTAASAPVAPATPAATPATPATPAKEAA